MAIVVFDIDKFRAIFPEFSNVSDTALQFLFDTATDYLNNSNYSIVKDVAKRERLLYLLMAHIAFIRYGDANGNGGNGSKGFVGRISSASEGSVSIGAALDGADSGSTWFTQSTYGYDFWQATKVYRMATYFPGQPEDPVRFRHDQ